MKEQKTETTRGACTACSAHMVRRNYKHIEKVGEKLRVTDETGQVLRCSKCDEVELSLKDLASYQRRAAAIVLRDAKKIDGSVVRYARKAMGLRQTDLADLLGSAAETVSRWETNALEMPRAEQLALVAILDGVGLYDGNVADFIEHERRGRPSGRDFEVPHARRAGCG